MTKVNYAIVMSTTHRCLNVIIHQQDSAPIKNMTELFFGFVEDKFQQATLMAVIFV